MKKFLTLIIALAFTGVMFAQEPAKVEAKTAAPVKTEATKDAKAEKKVVKKTRKHHKVVKEAKTQASTTAPVTK
jgi:hypothetical protein